MKHKYPLSYGKVTSIQLSCTTILQLYFHLQLFLLMTEQNGKKGLRRQPQKNRNKMHTLVGFTLVWDRKGF